MPGFTHRTAGFFPGGLTEDEMHGLRQPHGMRMGPCRLDINRPPEWFTSEPAAEYEVHDVETDTRTTHTGKALIDGLPVTLGGRRNQALHRPETMKEGSETRNWNDAVVFHETW